MQHAALLAALGMVVVAVLIRQAVDGDGSDRGSPDDAGVVVCSPDLADVCDALPGAVEVRIEDPADTAAALADGSAADDVDTWITSTAWLEVAESRAPDAIGGARGLATTSTTVAAADGRQEAIAQLCAGDDVWQCLGANAGTSWAELGVGSSSWGELKVGLPDADLAIGLPVIASASAGYFGSTDFAANDLDQSEFEVWLATLAAASGEGDPSPAQTMATRQGSYSAAGDTEAAAVDLAGRGVQGIDPEVAVSATIAAVELVAGDGLVDTDPVREALVQEGWRADDEAVTPTLKPGVMAALHSLWRELTS